MLEKKIHVTDTLREVLRNKRIEKKISGSELSQQINQTESYISALENKRIKHIPNSTLIAIVKLLFNLNSDDEVETKINELLTMKSSTDAIENNIDDEQIDSDLKNKLSQPKIIKYNTFKEKNIETQINDFAELFKRVLTSIYKEDSEIVFRILKIFPRNFAFDIGFMCAILEAPFFAFKKLNHDERQAYLNEFADLFNKYALLAKSKKEDSEDNDKTKQDEPPTTESNPNDSGD